jgi:hypothetical protein
MELAIIITAIAAAAAFASWRVWLTLRVAQGKSQAGGCAKCPANQRV